MHQEEIAEYIEKINSPDELKNLTIKELTAYCEEIRDEIVGVSKKNGGHLASNLGIVELTACLHYVFNSPKDKLIFDVGHQTYAHKIITGRREKFKNLRTNEGTSGMPNHLESEHDMFTSGHSSSSLSLALGLSRARDLKKETHHVVSIVGDGAMTGGMSYEALNDIGANKERVIIILNDNEMSISKNVGALSKHLARLRLSRKYNNSKRSLTRFFSRIPLLGRAIIFSATKIKNGIRALFQRKQVFELLGLKYLGPFNGHDVSTLVKTLERAKKSKGPVLLHVVTKKGKGHVDAEQDARKFHAVSRCDGESAESFSKVCGKTLTRLANSNKQIVAITAAMSDGVGLNEFAIAHKDRFFDVAIAEQHATLLAAGLAKGEMKPYFCVYSSFLQRSYDQLVHEVSLNSLPVTLLIDRAGTQGEDGVTHQGLYDLSFLMHADNFAICSPKDGKELEMMIEFSQNYSAPLAIRYPRNFKTNYESHEKIEIGKWEVVKECEESNNFILAVGNRMLDIAKEMENANVINARFIKPLDEEFLQKINKPDVTILTMEDNIKSGGFGESVLSYLNSIGQKASIKIKAFETANIDNRDIKLSLKENGFTYEEIEKEIKN
ncbi:MAG: 1-deoxy-D-xylulose-5-phosphate synthase [Firmicutes bacterium]|nr:1-deoxy-D-xylulose-5-phosphate synthase [Bacillota bacterium]